MAFVAFNSFQRMASNKKRAAAGGGGGGPPAVINYNFQTTNNIINPGTNDIYLYNGANIRTFGSYRILDVSNSANVAYAGKTPSTWTGSKALINSPLQTYSGLNLTSASYTVTSWVYIMSYVATSGNNYNITIDNSTGFQILFGVYSVSSSTTCGGWFVQQNAGQYVTSGTTPTLNTWTFLSLTFTNNSVIATVTPTGGTYPGVTLNIPNAWTLVNPLYIGLGVGYESNVFSKQYYANWRLYAPSLTSTQIGSIFSAGIE